MRRLRPALVLAILVLTAVWAAAGSGNHDPQQPIPGIWDVAASATEPAGTITFEVVSREVGEPAISAIYSVPPGYCAAGSDYYLGSYTRGGDSGTVAGCGPAYGPIFAQYRSTTGLVRRFVVTLVGGTLSASDCLIVNEVTNECEPRERFTATFAGHGAGAPPEEPPEKPLKCLGEEATILADAGAPPGTPITGTEGRDVIVGTKGSDIIVGGGGADLICGKGGDDTIDAGEGLDFVLGDGGSDVIRGGGGVKHFEGGPGNDRLLGGDERDSLDGGPGNDELRGEFRSDILRGGPGNDVIDGGTGLDDIGRYGSGSSGDFVDYGDSRSAVAVDLIAGRATGEGQDRLLRVEFVKGSKFDDELRGSRSDDLLLGGGGKDLILGRDGFDVLYGQGGDDRLEGGFGEDRLLGGPDDDVVIGGPGPDDLADGEQGTDSCRAEFMRKCERIAVGPGVIG